jgi:uncharacterized membrane protein
MMGQAAANALNNISLKRKITSILYTLILIVGLVIMISPLPEGTIMLSFVLSYFGYRLTGNIYVTVATYIVTFIITLVLIKKLDLVIKFKKQLQKIRSKKEKPA